MSTKNIFPLVIAAVVLVLTGLGAAKFVSTRTQTPRDDAVNQTSRAEGMRLQALNSQHSEALAQETVRGGSWYGAIPVTSNLFDATKAQQMRDAAERHSEALAQEPLSLHDRNTQHSEALAQEPAQSFGWYGAIPQTSPLFNRADAEHLRDLMEQHGEALQEVAP